MFLFGKAIIWAFVGRYIGEEIMQVNISVVSLVLFKSILVCAGCSTDKTALQKSQSNIEGINNKENYSAEVKLYSEKISNLISVVLFSEYNKNPSLYGAGKGNATLSIRPDGSIEDIKVYRFNSSDELKELIEKVL